MQPSDSKRIKLSSVNRYINELRLADLKYELDGKTVLKIKEYFEKNKPKKNYVGISSKFYVFPLIKVFQCLESPLEDCVILEVDSNQTEPNQIIKNMKNSTLSIIIYHSSIGLEDLLLKLKNHPSKVVVITTVEENRDPSFVMDETGFKELQSESKQKIMIRNISFDGVNVPLHKLGSMNFFDELNDSTWLSKLLTDGELVLKKRNLPIFDEDSHINRTLELHYDKIPKNDSESDSSEDTNDCTDNSLSEDGMIDLENKLIIVSDEQGSGKTKLLQSVLHKIKRKDPSCWVELITLTNHIQDLREMNLLDSDSVDFLSKNFLKYDLFTSSLFKHQIYDGNNMIIMFDAFDEISPADRELFIGYVRKLLKTNVKQIWITERNRSLEHEFSEKSYKIYSFMYQNQVRYFVNYWTGNKPTDELKTLAGCLMSHIHRYDIKYELPLITEMLAVYLVDNYKNMDSDLQKDFSKTSLFSKFIRSKHSEEMDEIHQRIALKFLCPEYGQENNFTEEEVSLINSIGIAAIHDGEMINFIHQELAELYVAQKVLNDLGNNERILDFLLIEVVNKSNFKGVRTFLNFLLPSVILPQNTVKRMGERMKVLIENNLIEVKDESTQILEEDYLNPYRDQENVIKMYYEVVHLLNLENLEKYKKYLPKISIQYSTDSGFIEKILDDNLKVVQYNVTDLEFFYGVLRLDLIEVVKKLFKALEKQLETKEKLKEFLHSKYPKDCIPQRTFLVYVGRQCFDLFLNYLHENITPFEDFKSFLVITNDYECYFDKMLKLPWIESLMDVKFYELCTQLSNIEPFDKEERCIEYHKLIVASEMFDNLLFSHNLLIKAIKSEFPRAVEKILEFLEKPIKENGKFEDMNEIMKTATYHGTVEILKKILQFYSKVFIDRKEELMKVIIAPINLLTFAELQMFLDSENFKNYTPKILIHVRTIGIVGVLLRVALSRKAEAQKGFDDFIRNELLPITTFSNDELKGVISLLNAGGKSYSYVMHYVQEAFTMEGLFKILHILLPEPYAKICCKNTLISDYCYYLLEKNIFVFRN